MRHKTLADDNNKRIPLHPKIPTAWAAMVTVLFELHPDQVGVHISPIPHQLMSSALGLLLVFRTNAVRRG